MDIYEAVKTRTSIRKYKSDPIPEDKLERVLGAMRRAPSGKNAQPWRFVIVKDGGIRAKLADACRGQQFVGEAPVVVVGCGWEDRAYTRMGGYWSSLPVDIAIALDHLTLAAVAEGLGTCWIGAYDEENVKEILGIPEKVKVIALTPLGFPDVEPASRPRKSLEEIITIDRWT